MFFRVGALVAVALLLALGMASLGVVSADALRERDRAVRDGVLLVLAQEIQSELRQIDPQEADQTVASFLERHSDSLAGVEVATPSGVVARAGKTAGVPTESSAALGPAWRELAFGGGGFPGAGSGRPPFTFRLYPVPALGHHGRMATAVQMVSVATAAALFILALLASHGLLERERRLTAEAEQRRLHVAALAGAGLAHRIRTPLATIKGTAQLLQAGAASERAGRIVGEADRIDGMIRRLLEFARPPEAQPERFDVSVASNGIAARAGATIAKTKVVFAFADPVHFEMALEELLSNARAFSAEPIDIEIGSRGGQAVVEVRDHGPGLSIAPQQAVEPYVTTRADGTGLGLAIVDALMRSNGGQLDLRNAADGGCIATLRLPEAS